MRVIAFLGACLLAMTPLVAQAQSAPVIGPTSFSSPITGNAITVPLNGGQSICTVNIYSIGGGATIVPQASSDGTTYVTVTSISGGSISTIGTWTGSISGVGLTQFQLAITSITSGTVTGSVTCSTAGGGGGGGGASGGPGGVPTLSKAASCLISTSNPVVCLTHAGNFFGAVNVALTAQTVTVTCYDNATTATGYTVAIISPVGLTQSIQWPAIGDYFSNGLTCQATGTPNTNGTGTGIKIFVQ